MKKLIILLFISSILISGCSISRVRENSIDDIIEQLLKQESKLKNVNFDGYSYYIPKGLSFLEKEDYNAILRDQYNNYYYLYVDVVSKYHKIKDKYKVDSKAYYSKALNKKDKFGYLEINQVSNGYFIEAMYNYAKIESYVDKKHLKEALINISLVLSSVKYNDKVLDTIVGENILNYKEENYNIFKTKKSNNDFLDYIKEYDSYDKDETDEDNLQIEEGE